MPLLAADDGPPGRLSILQRETTVPASMERTFAFFADAGNLDRLTPPWLDFAILTPLPLQMHAGAEIDYRIRLHGMALPWRSVIDVWEPGVRFVDRQTIGPYRWWRHEHRFVQLADVTTAVIDRVEYAPRVAWLSAPLVRRELERIFTYRQEALRRLLA